MNPEFLRPPIRMFEVKDNGQNLGEKLVRDGIFEIMVEKGDRPLLSEDAAHRKSLILRNKAKEELAEFMAAERHEEQVKEAGDFLAAADWLIRNVDVNQEDSEVLGDFQVLLDRRGITMQEAETARWNRAEDNGEYGGFKVVKSTAPLNGLRIERFYAGNEQWVERRVYYYDYD